MELIVDFRIYGLLVTPNKISSLPLIFLAVYYVMNIQNNIE